MSPPKKKRTSPSTAIIRVVLRKTTGAYIVYASDDGVLRVLETGGQGAAGGAKNRQKAGAFVGRQEDGSGSKDSASSSASRAAMNLSKERPGVLECLQNTLLESVKDWVIGASNYEIINVRTK